MSFDWIANKRVPPNMFLEMLRGAGAKLVNLDTNAVVAYARGMMSPSAAADNAKLGSLARELAFAQEWARDGFPQIVVNERLFASLAATSIPREALPDVGLPWNCFIVRIPDEFQEPIHFGRGIDLPIAFMSVRRFVDSQKNWLFEAKPSDAPGASFAVNMTSLGDLVDERLESAEAKMAMDWDTSHGARTGNLMKEVQLDDRFTGQDAILLAMRRAFVNVVLEMTRSEHRRAINAGRRRSMRTLRGAPKAWTFRLSRPVTVDCRQWLRDVTRRRTRKSITVQSLVRGHWKNQRCGPGGTERKFIHIEPYWRGPEDAPIAVRPHILKGGNDNQQGVTE